jgi:peptide/nickel transport system permease protein
LVHLAPGDPADVYVEPGFSLESAHSLRRHWGLDRPLAEQYLVFLGNLFRGDLGTSFFQGRPVRDVVLERLPRTLQLSAAALALAFGIGIAAGTFAASREGRRADRAVTLVALFFYSAPGFWLALLATIVFVDGLHLFPGSGMSSVGAERLRWGSFLGDRLWHLALPAFSLAAGAAAGVSRYVRAGVSDALREDFVFAARARGIPDRRVLVRHALRSALLPVISLLGLYLPFLFGGSIVIESVFAWPGMGHLLWESAFKRDYPLVLGTSFLLATVAIAGSLLADVLYAVADPRIRRPRVAAGEGGT